MKEMPNNHFSFKQFTIQQSDCAMKVGTDGVLLGAWAPTDGVKRILDVGTGTGLIALQLAQRQPQATIDAVEIDAAAAAQAQENVKASPWADRVRVVCKDFRHYDSAEKYDLIVSNPPYFVNALHCPDEQRNTARHTNQLNYELLFGRSAQLLAQDGQIAIIIPSEVGPLVVETAWKYGLHPRQKLQLFTKPTKPCRRWMLSFAQGLAPCQESSLVIHRPDGSYTEAYQQLTSEFYLY